MTRATIERMLIDSPPAKHLNPNIREWHHIDAEEGIVVISAEEMARLCARGVVIAAEPVWSN
jgi:hypothetical protein